MYNVCDIHVRVYTCTTYMYMYIVGVHFIGACKLRTCVKYKIVYGTCTCTCMYIHQVHCTCVCICMCMAVCVHLHGNKIMQVIYVVLLLGIIIHVHVCVKDVKMCLHCRCQLAKVYIPTLGDLLYMATGHEILNKCSN